VGVWHNFTDGKRYQGNLRQWIDDMKQWTWEEHTEMKTVEWRTETGEMIHNGMIISCWQWSDRMIDR